MVENDEFCLYMTSQVELDYRTDHQFTEPTTNHGKKLVENDEILFYIDFTGPPGGVVE